MGDGDQSISNCRANEAWSSEQARLRSKASRSLRNWLSWLLTLTAVSFAALRLASVSIDFCALVGGELPAAALFYPDVQKARMDADVFTVYR